SEDQRQSLITSLFGFVRRVSFHGADSPEEALGFSEIVGLLLGVPLTADCVVDEAESYCMQESENSGISHVREGCCCRCFECTE
ncbi:MAG: hypothetical protein IJP54_05185, partial [Synergistaceae bacterium]|nr:hypothetical protein [Synergistaceae bacterium]